MINKVTQFFLIPFRFTLKQMLPVVAFFISMSVVSAQTRDYADAPNTYSTAFASNGPSHLPSAYNSTTQTANLMLGARIDIETDGTAGTLANGDDVSGVDDEDAITRFPLLAPSATFYSIIVSVVNTTGATATLNGWIDLNRNGVFEATELATVTVANGAASATLSWTGFSAVATSGYMYARFRIASNAAEIALPTGAAASGEVEDHRFFIGRTVAGSVFNDINRNTRIDAGENFGSLPAPMYVYIVQAGVVVDSASVAANGTYSLLAPAGQSCTIELSTQQYPIGYIVNTTNIIDHTPPAGYVTTGENNSGTNTGNGDLNANGIISINVTANLTNRNFGITCKRAGTSASWDICANDPSVMPLSDFLTDEDDGGTWTQLTGSGMIFDGGANTVQLTSSATTATFQYSMPATSSCTASSSVVTIVVRAIPVTSRSITICQGQSVCVVNPVGTVKTLYAKDSICYFVSGVYSDTLVGASQYGCDSIVITNLTVVPVPTLSVTHATCSNPGSVKITSPAGAAYTYSKDGVNYQASPDFINFAPGNYTFYAKNNTGTCATSSSVTINNNCIVPVTLSNFDAYKKGTSSELVWTTETEQNNRGFSVEYSTDAVSWSTIAFVNSNAANGNSAIRLQYSYVHLSPVKGNNFYRLKQTDFDNKAEYSTTKNVVFKEGAGITLYPNPVLSQLYLNGAGKSTGIQLFNAYGQMIKVIPVISGNTLRIDMSGLAAGMYIIKVTADNEKTTGYKVIKK